jgi:ATP-binding cassette, subfamily B, bacterial PglK
MVSKVSYKQIHMFKIIKNFDFLDFSQKKIISGFIVIQVFLALIDLFGIILISLASILIISILTKREINSEYLTILEFLHLGDFPLEKNMTILAVFTLVFFILKTFLTIAINRLVSKFLASLAVSLSSNLFLNFSEDEIQKYAEFDEMEINYALNEGVSYGIIGIIGSFISLISEMVSLILVLVFLLLISVSMTLWLLLTTIVYGLSINYSTGRKNSKLSIRHTKLINAGHTLFSDFSKMNRELHASGNIRNSRDLFKQNQERSTQSYATLLYFQSLPKLILELLIVGTVSGLVIVSLVTNDFYSALSEIFIFFAALTRLAPTILRFQQAYFGVNYYFGHSGKFFEVNNYFNARATQRGNQKFLETSKTDLVIDLVDVDFKYARGNRLILEDISFKINQGDFVAFVGASGAGKSTLCDLVLGLLMPSRGRVTINGIDAKDFVYSHPGKIAYVPQSVNLISGSIARNVALGDVDPSPRQIEDALRRSGLEKLIDVSFLESNTETKPSLSGGEIQRIGLARALLSSPRVIILDEPTNSLDQVSIDLISKTLEQCRKQKITLIVVAHQLETITKADRILYLEEKRIKSVGTFEEVRKSIPSFDYQAKRQRF